MPEISSVDLPQEISRSASQAALCLTDAKGGAARLEQPALSLYLGGCVGVADPDWSDAQLLATFERVVKLAPKFPKGWGSVAVARAISAEDRQDRSGAPDVAEIRSTREAIAMARKLDSRSGLAYLAEWHLVQADPLKGLALLDKAVEVAPDEPLLHARRADALAAVGRMAESVDEARRAVELDPLSSFTRAKFIGALMYAGHLTNAKEEIAKAYKTWPNNLDVQRADLAFSMRYGDPRHAEQLVGTALSTESDQETVPVRKVLIAREDPATANVEGALSAWRTAMNSSPPATSNYLLALGTFGRLDDALRLIGDRRARAYIDTQILFAPEFEKMRQDARFMAAASRYGLVRYWRSSGHWPDFCDDAGLGYDCKTEAARYR